MISSASATEAVSGSDEGRVNQVAHGARRRVVRQRRDHGAVAGLPLGNAAADQPGGGNQGTRARHFCQCPVAQSAQTVAQRNQRPRRRTVGAAFALDDRRLTVTCRELENRTLRIVVVYWVSILQQVLITGVCKRRPTESPRPPRPSRPSCRWAACAGSRSRGAAQPPCPGAPRRPHPDNRWPPRGPLASAKKPSCQTVPSWRIRKRPMRSLEVRSSWHEMVTSGHCRRHAMCSRKRVLPQPVGPLSMTARRCA